MRRSILALAAVMVFGLALGGCRRDKQMDMGEMMKPAARPSQLDRLGAFVGNWESSWEMKDPSGKMTKGTGTTSAMWEADKWVVAERFAGTMGDQKMSGVSIWSYDPKKNNYPMVWYDSMGGSSCGVGMYDEATRTWKMKGESRSPQTGKKVSEEGTMRFVDENTMEWVHSMKSGGMTVMEMKGTSKRK